MCREWKRNPSMPLEICERKGGKTFCRYVPVTPLLEKIRCHKVLTPREMGVLREKLQLAKELGVPPDSLCIFHWYGCY